MTESVQISKDVGVPKNVPTLHVVEKSKKNNKKQSAENHRVNRDDVAQMYYTGKNHHRLPHVVKFSGGRSSAMLLFTLLQNGILHASRGDVIIFNNTSAEHPETYKFVATCKRLIERVFGIPFFWLEFQTYEDARAGEWTRLPSYRLVKPIPYSQSEPFGFHWQGEVFEELISWSGFVPNQHQRICTNQMKLLTSRNFLRDWFANKDSIDHLGHYGKTSRIDPDSMYKRHLSHGGGVPKDIFLRKKKFVLSRPVSRPNQRFCDYSLTYPFRNEAFSSSISGGQVTFGKNGAEYVSLVGLRADEPHRIHKVKKRATGGPESDSQDGEHVYMPLSDLGVSKSDVEAFWAQQEWGLELSARTSLSNCAFCFLKGVGKLKEAQEEMNSAPMENPEFGSLKDTPCDVEWWERVENEYGRDLAAEGRITKEGHEEKRIGFFGTRTKFSYSYLSKSSDQEVTGDSFPEVALPCECTD